jgi:hypothetical protein
MTMKPIAFAAAFGAALLVAQGASAFECPKHFAEAQGAIDKVSADMKAAGDKVAKADMALIHALLDDAKTLLTSAEHNHAKPQGKYDHARAIAKADSATAYAGAADLYLGKAM